MTSSMSRTPCSKTCLRLTHSQACQACGPHLCGAFVPPRRACGFRGGRADWSFWLLDQQRLKDPIGPIDYSIPYLPVMGPIRSLNLSWDGVFLFNSGEVCRLRWFQRFPMAEAETPRGAEKIGVQINHQTWGLRRRCF